MSEINRFSHLLQVEPRKVRDYLLNPDHPEGGTKARFFELLGFSREQPWDLGAHRLDRGTAGSID